MWVGVQGKQIGGSGQSNSGFGGFRVWGLGLGAVLSPHADVLGCFGV